MALRLPQQIKACLFDLDGVLTDTASAHSQAWAQTLDEFLAARGAAPFSSPSDYEVHLDGKPRIDGVRDFLLSRGIDLPDGNPDAVPGVDTVAALANKGNDAFLKLIQHEGVRVFPGTEAFLDEIKKAGLRTAVVSSSSNAKQILTITGLTSRIDEVVDGAVQRAQHLQGKPHPDPFLAAAGLLHVSANEAAVFEDALVGVQAGKAGGFSLVVGVNKVGPEHAAQLRECGADLVVDDLAELIGEHV